MKEKIIKTGEEIADFIKDLKEVKSIGFMGSIGRGNFDKYSDIDIIVYVDEIPSPNKRKKLLEDRVKNYEKIIPEMEIFYYKNKEVSFFYRKISDLEKAIKKLYKENHEDKKISEEIKNIRPIYGKEIIKNLQQKIKNFPDGILNKKLYNLRKITTLFKDLEKYLERKQLVWMNHIFEEILEDVISITYTLNKKYYGGYLKWFEKDMKDFNKLPKNSKSNLEKYIRTNPIENLPQKLTLLKKIFFGVVDLLNKEQKKGLKIKSEKWYDSRIEEIKNLSYSS